MLSGVKIDWKELEPKLLDAIIECRGMTRYAIKKCGISHGPFYQRLHNNPEFAEKVKLARQAGAQALRDVCYEDAMMGTKEPVFSGGKPVTDKNGNPMFVRRIPWGARMRFLEATFPDEFGKQRHEISGPNGGPIDVNANVRIYLPDNGRKPQEDVGAQANPPGTAAPGTFPARAPLAKPGTGVGA